MNSDQLDQTVITVLKEVLNSSTRPSYRKVYQVDQVITAHRRVTKALQAFDNICECATLDISK